MSLVVERDRYCGVPDWCAAVKRIDAAATIHPADDDWPVSNAKTIVVGCSQSGR
jgi:hypothetical protein